MTERGYMYMINKITKDSWCERRTRLCDNNLFASINGLESESLVLVVLLFLHRVTPINLPLLKLLCSEECRLG